MGSFSIVSPHDRLGQDASLMSNGALINHQLCFGPLDRTTISRAKPVCRPRPSLCHLCFAIARRGIGHEGAEQLFCGLGDLVHGSLESDLVCLGRPSKATQLADELERRCPDFVLCRWRFEVMERLDIAAHIILTDFAHECLLYP